MQSGKLDYVVYVFTNRFIFAHTAFCLEQLHLKGERYMWIPVIGDAGIGRDRSIAMTRFITTNPAPYMVMLDSDIVFQPEQMRRLVSHLKSGEYHLIGGLYAVRNGTQLSSMGWGGTLEVDGQIREVRYLASGFTGVSRRLLQDVRDKLNLPHLHPKEWAECYPFCEAGARMGAGKAGENIFISEDWDFSDKARKAGYIPYADTGILVEHIGDYNYSFRDVLIAQGLMPQIAPEPGGVKSKNK